MEASDIADSSDRARKGGRPIIEGDKRHYLFFWKDKRWEGMNVLKFLCSSRSYITIPVIIGAYDEDGIGNRSKGKGSERMGCEGEERIERHGKVMEGG